MHQPYLTFRDGRRYQVAIDAIRVGAGWCAVPDYCGATMKSAARTRRAM